MKNLAITLLLTCIVASYSAKTDTTNSPKRCAATTKKGTQCKRDADKGSIYCWQHKKK